MGNTNTMDKVTITQAQPKDAEAIHHVRATTWLATYPNAEHGITKEAIRRRVEGEHGELVASSIAAWKERIKTAGVTTQPYVARLDGKVVGFGGPMIIDGIRWVGALYVLPEAQGFGIGSQLMQKILDWHGNDEDIFLAVAEYNTKSIRFYERFGFQVTGKKLEDKPAVQSGNVEIPEIEMVLERLNKN